MNAEDVESKSWTKSDSISHTRKRMIKDEDINKLYCDIYELLPGKSNWPLHYHTSNEEVFYIISGYGEVITDGRNIDVKPSDIVRFPAGKKGVHQLKNTSENEVLKYLNFGTCHYPDVVFMPVDNKIELFSGDAGDDEEMFLRENFVKE